MPEQVAQHEPPPIHLTMTREQARAAMRHAGWQERTIEMALRVESMCGRPVDCLKTIRISRLGNQAALEITVVG